MTKYLTIILDKLKVLSRLKQLIMSEKHLTKGSVQPPKTEGLLRLYSMKFCPFAQRVRLVLDAKDINFETVNINLLEKPEWYLNVHPEGKVPALDTGSKIVVESLDICDFLDETYADKPLYPSDPAARQNDKDLIQKFGPLVSIWAKCCFNMEQKSAAEWVAELEPYLEIFEKELAKRGTPFLGGDKPGMVDYMMWPWAERGACISYAIKEKLPLKDDQIPLLKNWRKTMRKDPTVDRLYIGPERFWKIASAKIQGTMPEYDTV